MSEETNQTDLEQNELESEVNEQSDEGELSLEQQVAQLEEALAEQKDLTLRTHAELENFRRRAKEDIEAAHKYAINKFVGNIIPVKDNLEMALADTSGQFENLKFGVELTLKEFVSALNGAHVEEINPEGGKLDPHFHQAMQTEETDEIEANTIIRVLKKGYKVGERLIRPALVVVAVAKENEDKDE